MPQLGGLSGDSFAHLDARALGKLRRVAHLKAKAQFLSLFVQQKNGEDFIVDDFAHHLRDAAQSRIQVERRRQNIGNFQQQRLNLQMIFMLAQNGPHCFFYDSSRALSTE